LLELQVNGKEDGMAAKRGLQQRLKEEIRKRREKPRPHVVPTGNVRRDRWEEITRGHEDVLQNIEATLVACWQEAEGLDDAWVHVALVATMRDDPPDHPTSWFVYSQLKAIRAIRADVDPELWLDALRVVDQSVRDHSSLHHGDRSYLTFILPYVAPALGDADPDYEIIEGRISPPQLPET
jgi:hypothetical protein